MLRNRLDRGPQVPILMFHDLGGARSPIAFPTGLFADALRAWAGRGYRAAGLDEVVDSLRRGRSLPDRTIVLTFDDGYRSVYETAFPLIHDLGWSATAYLTVGRGGQRRPEDTLPSIDGRDMLSWRQIVEMHEHGIGFGAHSLTHPDLRRLPDDEVTSEIQDSGAVIEDCLGSRVGTFAYPYGLFDRRAYDAARTRYESACTVRLGLVRAADDPHALPRVDACYLRNRRAIDELGTPALARRLTVRAIPRRLRRRLRHGRGGIAP